MQSARPRSREAASLERDSGRGAPDLARALRDADADVRLAAVHAFAESGDPGAVLPLYELVQDDQADVLTRHAAAEELVTLGLLRRKRVGASRPFLWLVGLALVIVAAAAVETIGIVGAILLFIAGAAALALYDRRVSVKERESGTYIGPDAATITIPVTAPPT